MSVTSLQPEEARALLKGPARSKLLVVDVRDEDFLAHGGHIAGCINFPQEHFESNAAVDAFIERRLAGQGLATVLVHCYLCEQRGPFCAKRLASRLQAAEMEEPQVCFIAGGFKGFKQLYGDDSELVVGDDEPPSPLVTPEVPETCCYPTASGKLRLAALPRLGATA